MSLASAVALPTASGTSYFNGGSYFDIPITTSHSLSTVSFELVYKGNVIYNSAA
jgi:hypothetical protein